MTLISQRLPLVSALALLVLMLASLAWQALVFYSRHQTAGMAAEQTISRPVVRQQPKVDLTAINLFGEPSSTQVAQDLKTAELPETNLRLILRGVIAGSEKAPNSVLVEGPDQQTDRYRIGDTLPGNAKLKAVYDNRIVIERGGRLENLYFPQDELGGSGIDVTRSASGPEPGNGTPDTTSTYSAQGNTTQAAQGGYGLSDERKAEIQDKLRLLRERLRSSYQ